MTFDVWPEQLSAAPAMKWRRREVTTSAGVAVDSSEQRGTTDGGGKWELTMSGIWLRRAGMIQLASALEVMMDGGSKPIIVNACECASVPVPAGVICHPDVPHSDLTPFSDEALYRSGNVTATAYANAARRAVEMTVFIGAGRALMAGEAFSIYHAPPRGYASETGKRRYKIGRVGEPVAVTGGFTQIIKFRTPLRAAVTVGTVLDFDSVGMVAFLQNPDDFFEDIEMGRFSRLNPVWVEAL